MSEKKIGGISLQEGNLVVKNKKFKKSDIIAFGVCLLVALFIWIYASNASVNDEISIEDVKDNITVTQAE